MEFPFKEYVMDKSQMTDVDFSNTWSSDIFPNKSDYRC